MIADTSYAPLINDAVPFAPQFLRLNVRFDQVNPYPSVARKNHHLSDVDLALMPVYRSNYRRKISAHSASLREKYKSKRGENG